MSSYFSSLTSSTALSNIGTRLNTLRRAITSGEEADDSDNEDCSHVSNVLRAYYTEKGRPFPPWLPPDPKAAAPTPRIIAATQLQHGAYSSGSQQSATASPTPSFSARSGSGLGDLWGDSSGATVQPSALQTASLRRPRGNNDTLVAPSASGSPPALTAIRSAPSLPSAQEFGSPRGGGARGARPLPSQRPGSYQVTQTSRMGLERTASSSAQERLRARFQSGGRSLSPSAGSATMQGSTSHGPSASGTAARGPDPENRRPIGLPSGPRPQGPR